MRAENLKSELNTPRFLRTGFLRVVGVITVSADEKYIDDDWETRQLREQQKAPRSV